MTNLRTPSACFLGSSTVHTLIVSFPRRHSSLVLRLTIRRARGGLQLSSAARTESTGDGAMAGSAAAAVGAAVAVVVRGLRRMPKMR